MQQKNAKERFGWNNTGNGQLSWRNSRCAKKDDLIARHKAALYDDLIARHKAALYDDLIARHKAALYPERSFTADRVRFFQFTKRKKAPR